VLFAILHEAALLGPLALVDILVKDCCLQPSWISLGQFWNTLEELLMVYVTVQNSVVIGAIVFVCMKFSIFREFGLKTPISQSIVVSSLVSDLLNG